MDVACIEQCMQGRGHGPQHLSVTVSAGAQRTHTRLERLDNLKYKYDVAFFCNPMPCTGRVTASTCWAIDGITVSSAGVNPAMSCTAHTMPAWEMETDSSCGCSACEWSLRPCTSTCKHHDIDTQVQQRLNVRWRPGAS